LENSGCFWSAGRGAAQGHFQAPGSVSAARIYPSQNTVGHQPEGAPSLRRELSRRAEVAAKGEWEVLGAGLGLGSTRLVAGEGSVRARRAGWGWGTRDKDRWGESVGTRPTRKEQVSAQRSQRRGGKKAAPGVPGTSKKHKIRWYPTRRHSEARGSGGEWFEFGPRSRELQV
jgi:hypothetical protein